MKKIMLIAMFCFIVSACGQAARDSGFYKHDAMYQDWDHLWFSWTGYKHVTAKDVKESKADDWWGIPEEYKETK